MDKLAPNFLAQISFERFEREGFFTKDTSRQQGNKALYKIMIIESFEDFLVVTSLAHSDVYL